MMFFRRAIDWQGFKNEIFTAILITISFLGGGIEIVYGNFFMLFFMVIFSTSLFSNSRLLRAKICGDVSLLGTNKKFIHCSNPIFISFCRSISAFH